MIDKNCWPKIPAYMIRKNRMTPKLILERIKVINDFYKRKRSNKRFDGKWSQIWNWKETEARMDKYR